MKLRPCLLISAASQGRPIVDALSAALNETCEVTVELRDVSTGQPTVQDCASQIDHCDFASFILSPEDLDIAPAADADPSGDAVPNMARPRDLTLIRLGLFLGRLGRQRTFLIHGADDDRLQIPADVGGAQILTLGPRKTSAALPSRILPADLAAIVNRLQATVEALGVRESRRSQAPEHRLIARMDVSHRRFADVLRRALRESGSPNIPPPRQLQELPAKSLLQLARSAAINVSYRDLVFVNSGLKIVAGPLTSSRPLNDRQQADIAKVLDEILQKLDELEAE